MLELDELSGLHILFSYDDEIIKMLVKKVWFPKQLVDFTTCPKKFLELIEKNSYDLAIVPCLLKGCCGIKLASIAEEKNIPVLILDTIGTRDSNLRIMNKNFPSLSTPFNKEELTKKVLQVISKN